MKTILLMLAVASLSTLFLGCKKDSLTTDDMTAQINALPLEPLSAEEIESLMIMREEEKLAHDVYLTLYNRWDIHIFNNIASSEQTHTEAVLTLINKCSLSDPVQNDAVGVFEDSTLQALYHQLVAQGSNSLVDGFKVGATIEDLDIYDLNEWLTKVDNQDLTFVYQNLNKGSRNHMRSFYGQITSSGSTYAAQFITQSELEAIVNSPKEQGSH